ncbi:MAG: cytochrome c [Pyrinomonadaceae bacterium]
MRIVKVITIALWITFIAMTSTITGVTSSKADENGKDLYKVDCKVCHTKDSPNGEYTPMSLTQDQWRAFFDKKFIKTHKDVVLPTEKKKLLEFLTPDQIGKIKKFCIDHAADSEQPQTCS